jgi:heat shock protein beta
VQKEVSKEVVDEEAEKEEEKKDDEIKPEDDKKDDDMEVKEGDDEKKEEKKPKMKTIKEKTWEWELVNDSKAIWLRDKAEIEDSEYNGFYKSLTKDYDDPSTFIHFRAEGEVEFRSLLFVPKRSSSNQFENYHGKSSSLKLYVRRVLINEEFEELMPRYLNFVKGVVDSDDLPLNVSRESLQQLKMMKVISRKLVRKAIEMLSNLAK